MSSTVTSRCSARRRAAGEVRYWRAGHEDRTDRTEDAAFSPRADDPPYVARGKEFFRGFHDENAAVEDARSEGKPARGEDLFDDLKAAAPGTAGDGPSRPVPTPRLGRLTFTERVQGSRIALLHAHVF
jgi:hypothetical protein